MNNGSDTQNSNTLARETHPVGNQTPRQSKSGLRNNMLGIAAEILLALGLILIGFFISLLCGW